VDVLEDRTVPTTFIVTNTLDSGYDPSHATDPTRGYSLRQAILDANAVGTGTPGNPDLIQFDIPATDPGHLYYRDDGVAGQIGPANAVPVPALAIDGVTPITSDSQLANPALVGAGNTIDPDWAHSWWRIQPAGVQLPAIQRPVFIDGYTQPGAGWNTLANDDNAVLRVELNGRGPSPVNNGVGLTINGGSSTVRGLVINGFPAPSNGIILQGAGGDRVQGNFIGTDVSGTRAPYGLPDFSTVSASSSDLSNGVLVAESTGFQHDFIGTDSRTDPTDPPGWSDLAERNIISATGEGVKLVGVGSGDSSPDEYGPAQINNVVAGNFIGTDAHGKTALGNWVGIGIQGGSHDDLIGTNGDGVNDVGERNVISGNLVGSILNSLGGSESIGGTRSALAGNWIGLDVNGGALGNLWAGVAVLADVPAARIGGPSVVLGNAIAYNGTFSASLHYDLDSTNGIPYPHAPGVWIFSTLGTPLGITVQGNSIYGNAGLGIDLGGSYPPVAPDGVTLNDSAGHVGPNHYQNFPVLSSAGFVGQDAITGLVTITGTLPGTAPNTAYRIEFFYNNDRFAGSFYPPTADPSGYGEGQVYLGAATVSTDATGRITASPDGSAVIGVDADGNATFTFTRSGVAPEPTCFTATATNLTTGDTSEFSKDLSLPVAAASLTGDYSVTEGQSLALHAQVVRNPDGRPLSFSWDLNNDGNYDDAFGTDPIVPWADLVGLGYGDGPRDWFFPVRVMVRDDRGNVYAPIMLDLQLDAELDIINAPPTAAVSGPAAGVAGQELTFTLSADDPSPVDESPTPGVPNSGVFTYQIDWDGDGTVDQTITGPAQVQVAHAFPVAGSYTVGVWATDKDGGISPVSTATVQVNAMTGANLAQVVSPSNSVTILVNSVDDATTVVQAINDLFAQDITVSGTVSLELAPITYGGLTVNVPSGMTLVIGTANYTGGQQATIDPANPAFSVISGNVLVYNVTFVTTGDAPTILVTGGHLTLRGCTVQESSDASQAAIEVIGGAVDLGTAADPGGNTINVNGPGSFVRDTSGSPIPAVGTAFTVEGAPLQLGSLSGIVWEDFNDDGQIDFGEKGIANVLITLAGTDDLGNPVSQSLPTDSDGAYVFLNLRPGSYTITETQPAGYAQGTDSVGTAGGGLPAADQFLVNLAPAVNGLNYNFGERPAATGPVQKGQTAGIGFWNNRNGQALIKAFNGGTGTQLADWLAATLPHMFGIYAGSNDLTGKSNAYVAGLFQQDFLVKGIKLDAQVLATALSVYATNATLDSTGVAAQYHFTVSGDGVGTATVNVGSNGDAFGVANNTALTVMDLLLATDDQAVNGVLYNGNTTRRKGANDVYSALSQAGDIG
jgi:hypothetical protein